MNCSCISLLLFLKMFWKFTLFENFWHISRKVYTFTRFLISTGLHLIYFRVFPSKAEEMKNLVQNEYTLWVSQYLVMKRASIEPNFHQLYLEFMESLDITNFSKEVLKETYRNIKVCSYEIIDCLTLHVLSHPYISMHIPLTVFHTILKVLTRRIRLFRFFFFRWWLFPLFSIRKCGIQG